MQCLKCVPMRDVSGVVSVLDVAESILTPMHLDNIIEQLTDDPTLFSQGFEYMYVCKFVYVQCTKRVLYVKIVCLYVQYVCT